MTRKYLTIRVPRLDYEQFKATADTQSLSISQAFRDSFSKVLENPSLLGLAAADTLVDPMDSIKVDAGLYLGDACQPFKDFASRSQIGTKALSALVLRSSRLAA
jgi:hypothetical protein